MRRAYRRQPPRGTKVDGRSPLGRAITAHFTFNNTFVSSAGNKGRSPVVAGGPTYNGGPGFKSGADGWYAQGATGGGSSGGYVAFPDLLPSALGVVGAAPRTIIAEFYLADSPTRRGIFSLGDQSAGYASQFTLVSNNDYQQVSLQLYGVDPSFNVLDRGNTGAMVFVAITYDGALTLTCRSWAKFDVDGTVYPKTQSYTLSTPLATGNTVPLTLMGGGTYPNAWASMDQALRHLSIYGGRCLTPAEIDRLYADRHQVMAPRPAFPYAAIASAAATVPFVVAPGYGTGTADTPAIKQRQRVTVAAASSSTTASALTIKQRQRATVAAASSATTAGTVAAKSRHKAAAAPGSTSTASTTAAIKQQQRIGPVSAGSSASSGAALTIAQRQRLTVGNGTSAPAGANVILGVRTVYALPAPGSSATTASAATIKQRQRVGAEAAASLSSASAPRVAQRHRLTVGNSASTPAAAPLGIGGRVRAFVAPGSSASGASAPTIRQRQRVAVSAGSVAGAAGPVRLRVPGELYRPDPRRVLRLSSELRVLHIVAELRRLGANSENRILKV